jgi:hypothetical protein
MAAMNGNGLLASVDVSASTFARNVRSVPLQIILIV